MNHARIRADYRIEREAEALAIRTTCCAGCGHSEDSHYDGKDIGECLVPGCKCERFVFTWREEAK
jgi:hypothetical protein